MNTALQQQFDVLENQRVDVERSVLALSASQLAWKPDAADWSIQQIVEHLALSDETIGRACAGEAPAEPFAFWIVPRFLRRRLVLSAMNSDRVLPLPSADVSPKGDGSLLDLLSRWSEVRRAMTQDLEPQAGNELRYSHPILGPMTAFQMLELSSVHTGYHLRQIESRRSRNAFPLAESADAAAAVRSAT